MRRPEALYRVMATHLSRIGYLKPHADRTNNATTQQQHANPRTQKPVSGGFSFEVVDAVLTLALS